MFVFWFFEPFTTRPVSGFYLLVLFLFLYGLFVDAVCVLSLFLSLRRWEPQTFLVWGSPCVSSSWTRSSPSIRTSSSSPSPRRSPAPVFFFRRRRSFPVRCFFVSCLVGVGGLGGCTWSWSLSGCCLVSVFPLGLVALSSSSGWVGFPLPRFPCVFPLVLGGGGGVFLAVLLHLASVLHVVLS